MSCGRSEQPKTNATPPPSPAPSAENYPNLAVQAKEVGDAFTRRDFGRFIDLTYPKVIEMAGGREQMIAGFTKELKEMEAEGVRLLSSTVGAPTQFVHDTGSIYAVLPIILKVRAQDGIFQSEGNMIGVSTDGGANWTFIDASGKDQKELSAILPNAVGKLTLPREKPPVKVANN